MILHKRRSFSDIHQPKAAKRVCKLCGEYKADHVDDGTGHLKCPFDSTVYAS